MMLAAIRPELFGPLIIAGSPLSYWAGVRGKNPMRYSGGLLGGSWLTALTSDLGHGKFDGAWLVQNFENQNPQTRLWTKQYNLYSKIDTEAARYLGFERWWGGHVNLNAEEIQFIVDELFIGNKLAAGAFKTSDGSGDRFAQHSFADRRVLLEGRQHHATATGAGMDSRSLRRRRRNPLVRSDDRLHDPRDRRSSRNFRFVGRRAQGARRVFQQHRSDRYAAAGPLRGYVRARIRRIRPIRIWCPANG